MFTSIIHLQSSLATAISDSYTHQKAAREQSSWVFKILDNISLSTHRILIN